MNNLPARYTWNCRADKIVPVTRCRGSQRFKKIQDTLPQTQSFSDNCSSESICGSDVNVGEELIIIVPSLAIPWILRDWVRWCLWWGVVEYLNRDNKNRALLCHHGVGRHCYQDPCYHVHSKFPASTHSIDTFFLQDPIWLSSSFSHRSCMHSINSPAIQSLCELVWCCMTGCSGRYCLAAAYHVCCCESENEERKISPQHEK
jgi:hypothetical protein